MLCLFWIHLSSAHCVCACACVHSEEFIHSSAVLRVLGPGSTCILCFLFSESKNDREKVIFSPPETIFGSDVKALAVPTLCSIRAAPGSGSIESSNKQNNGGACMWICRSNQTYCFCKWEDNVSCWPLGSASCWRGQRGCSLFCGCRLKCPLLTQLWSSCRASPSWFTSREHTV